MMSLSPQRIERLAGELAARSGQAVLEAIKRYDVETKVAIRHAIGMQREAHGIQAQVAEPPTRRAGEQDGAYWCRRLKIHGPTTLLRVEAAMAAAQLPANVRIEVKTFAAEQGWLSPMLGHRLADETPALSLEMAALYRAAHLSPDDVYTPQEVDAALAASLLATHETMALRTELVAHHQLTQAASGEARDDWHQKAEALRDRLVRLRQLVHG